MNEGWASYWHEKLFLGDERIRGHEVEFARVHAEVAALPRIGINPYALGMRLFQTIEEEAGRGHYADAFQRLQDAGARERFDAATGQGEAAIFRVREDLSDFLFIQSYVDQDFVNRHNLFVTERRLDQSRMVWEFSVKSRKAEDYRQMLLDSLYHPPKIEIDRARSSGRSLYLLHRFEGKPLVRDYIANTLLGIEYLWGGPVFLETSEAMWGEMRGYGEEAAIVWQPVVYEMRERHFSRRQLL